MRKSLPIFLITAALSISAVSLAFAAQPEDIIKIKRDILISKSMVVNDVLAVHGSVTVYGRIDGNVVILGGSLYLKPEARISGHAVVIGGEVEKDPTAQIDGKITQVYFPGFLPSMATFLAGGWIAVWAAISVMVLLGFLGLAVLTVALVPDHIRAIVGAMESRFAMAFLWGVFWMIMIAPVAVLLAISIVGIVLIPLQILLVALALLTGYIASAIYVGKSISAQFKAPSLPFADAIIGVLILHAIGFVPFFGAAIKSLFIISGFGAVVTTRFGTIKR